MRQRLPLVAALLIASVTSKAQTKLDLSGLWDNWYVGATTGFNSKLTHNSFMGHPNPHLTLRAGRDIIPLVGVVFEATPFFNDQKFPYARVGYTDLYSKTGVKALNLHVLGNLNLHNLFKDYQGDPRFFEAHFIAGFGLNHVFGTETGSKNDLVSKMGFDLSLTFGDAKEWEAYIEPALNYNLTRYSDHVAFNPNYAAWQLAVGVNYHISRARKARKVSHAYTDVPVARSAVSSAVETSSVASVAPRASQRRQETDKAITYVQADAQGRPVKQQPAGRKFDRDEPVTPTGVKSVPMVPVVPVQTVPATPVTAQAGPDVPATVETEPATPVVKKTEPDVPDTVHPVKTATSTSVTTSTATSAAPAKSTTTSAAPAKGAKTTALGGSAAESPSATKTKATPKASKTAASSKGSKASAASASSTGLPAIRFKPGENNIADDQYESLTQVANYMKNRPRVRLVINGQRARTEAVRNALIRHFGINAGRLSTVSTTVDGVTFSQK